MITLSGVWMKLCRVGRCWDFKAVMACIFEFVVLFCRVCSNIVSFIIHVFIFYLWYWSINSAHLWNLMKSQLNFVCFSQSKYLFQLFDDLKLPLTTRGPYQVICHILLSFQHNPYVFHKVRISLV